MSLAAGTLPYVLLRLFGGLVESLAGEPVSQAQTAFLALLLGGTLMLQRVLSEGDRILGEAMSERFRAGLQQELAAAVLANPLQAFERPERLDEVHRLNARLSGDMFGHITMAFSSLTALLGVLSLCAILIRVAWWLPLLFITVLPSQISQASFILRRYSLDQMQTEKMREQRYYESLLLDRPSAAEVRAYRAAQYLVNKWSSVFRQACNDRLALGLRGSRQEVKSSLVGHVVTAGAIFLMIWLTGRGNVPLGDVVAGIPAAISVPGAMGDFLWALFFSSSGARLFREVAAFSGYGFSAQTGATAGPAAPLQEWDSLALHDVSFSYPGAGRKALENVSLVLRRGQKVAIVGPNGSGKTTLVKLILGLYDPDTGELALDGVPLRGELRQAWRGQAAAVFQDFWRLEASLVENVSLGQGGSPLSRAALDRVAHDAGLGELLESLPAGWSTTLGKGSHNGTELSTGQWQRVALARAFASRGSVIVFDEPTSFLDPLAEQRFWHMLNARPFAGSLVVYVSHRTAVSSLADFTVVLQDRQVAELGPTRELLAKGGLLAQLYAAERELYGVSGWRA
jgi:ABC-type multidrug transport system fused ATPase/permease subunit